MKKRVLSLLLMLAMVITALPMVAMPVLAVEEEDQVEEFDYDSLYETEGLIFAIDFFKSNPFWDPEGDDYTVPVGPSENSAYNYAGTMIDFTNAANRVDGEALSAAFKAAINSWKAADKAFLKQFMTASVNDTYAFSYAPGETAANAAKFFSAYTLGAGYIQIREDVHSSGGFQVTGFGKAANFTDSLAMQAVYDASATRKNPHILWHNIRPGFGTDNKLSGLIDASATFTVAENGVVANGAVDFSGVVNHLLTLDGAMTAGGTDVFAISDLGGTLATVTGTYIGNDNFKATVYFGWSNTMSNGKIYAIRQYNKGLSEESFRLNSFADLCKWYKLDMTAFLTLSTAQRLAACEEILAFAAAEDIAVGGDADDRAALQEKLNDYATDLVYNELTDVDTSPEAAAFKAVAKAVLADISGVLALPAEPALYRQTVYAAVLGMTDVQKASKSAVEAMIDQMIDNILTTHFGQYVTKTELTYKDIYVKQENIALWVDFFAAKESDGNLYMDVSYSDAPTKADGSPLPAGYTKNWDLPTWKDGNSKNGRNPDKIFITQVSGEKAARDKYIYKGGEFFEFADIPDAKWGHTNIRTWGNGKLICGHNNSLRIKSPGVEKAQVTYQFVAGWENQGTSSQDQMNIQLDGYRMNFNLDNGNVEGMFRIPQYTYYGYGVATDNYTLSNNALMMADPQMTPVYVGDMLDLTVTVNKFIGEDDGHYYMQQYLTNADGAIQYYENDTPPVALNISSVPKLYRYQIDGQWYFLSVTTSGGATTYSARYAETMVGKPKRIAHDGYIVESVPVIRTGDTMSFDWANAVYAMDGENYIEVATDLLGNPIDQLAANVYGPCYKNPFPEVPFGTPGAEGPITYRGTYELGVYANGAQCMYVTGLSYQASDIGWVGNSGNMTFYAVRTYDCVLTEEEVMQNHFADLAGYYSFDLAPYSLLSDAERTALHADLANMQLGLPYDEGLRMYEEAIDTYLYSFDEEIPNAANFIDLCHVFGLNTRTLKELSPESLTRIFAAFADMDPDARNYAPIVQKMVDDVVNAEIEEHYAAAYGHKSIHFEGWQLRKKGDLGMRAQYTTDLSLVPSLEEAGARVMTGVLMAPKNSTFKDLDDLTVSVDADGNVVIPEGAELAKGYWDGAVAAGATRKGNTLYFSYDQVFTDVDRDDIDALTEVMEKRYFHVGFTAIVVGEGEDREVSIFYDDATVDGGKTGAQSLLSLSRAAQKHKMAEENIQFTLNTLDVYDGDPLYIAVDVANRSLSEYKLVISADSAASAVVQKALLMTMGFSLNEVRQSDAAGKTGFVYIGSVDNVYESACYGISVLGGNFYLWYNQDAEASDVCDLFAEYLYSQQEAENNISFENGFELVRRVQ